MSGVRTRSGAGGSADQGAGGGAGSGDGRDQPGDERRGGNGDGQGEPAAKRPRGRPPKQRRQQRRSAPTVAPTCPREPEDRTGHSPVSPGDLPLPPADLGQHPSTSRDTQVAGRAPTLGQRQDRPEEGEEQAGPSGLDPALLSRAANFTDTMNRALIHGVLARCQNPQMTLTGRPGLVFNKGAWEGITREVNAQAASHRTPKQCKKRLGDIKRKLKQFMSDQIRAEQSGQNPPRMSLSPDEQQLLPMMRREVAVGLPVPADSERPGQVVGK